MTYKVNFTEVKSALNIEQVLAILGIEVKRVGPDRLIGRCPVHDGTDAKQFVVTPSKNLWNCFGNCGGGDQIRLAARVLNCDDKAAALELQKHLVSGAKPATPATRDFSKVRDKLVTDHPLLEPLGVSSEACKHFEAGFKVTGVLCSRLALPVHDGEGTLLGYCGRAVKKDQDPLLDWPKDLSGDGLLFNAHRIQPGELMFFSDPLKVLLAWMHDYQAVASYGPPNSEALEVLRALMERHEIKKVEIL